MISKNRLSQLKMLHNKKQRDEQKLFLVEGVKAVLELVNRRPEIAEEIFATEKFLALHSPLLKRSGIKTTDIKTAELERISTLVTPNEVLALCRYFEPEKTPIDFQEKISLYLDDIRDPGNFGTVVRLADWFGIDQIFCSPGSCDLYNPKVIQSTMGAFLRVKVSYVSLKHLIEEYDVKKVYGAILNGKNIYKEKLSSGLIVIGNESSGINQGNLSLVTHPISIPAHPGGGAESLNAAMAASIIISEFFRQENFGK